MKKLIVIVGPTASGKSDLGVQLAKHFSGEVISADSRQVYKGLDIGSGKIAKKEMMGIPHHLLDVASPKRRFSVLQYQKLAQKEIKRILKIKNNDFRFTNLFSTTQPYYIDFRLFIIMKITYF